MPTRSAARCRNCGKKFGRRTNRAGQLGYCSKTCWHADEVRTAIQQPEKIRFDNSELLRKAKMSLNEMVADGGMLPPAQARNFVGVLLNHKVLGGPATKA